MQQKPFKISRGYKTKHSTFTPIIVIGVLLVAAIVFFIIAFSMFILNDNSEKDYSLQVTLSSSQEEEEGNSSSQEEVIAATPFDGTIVPETIAADADYFSDALFVGDSISLGLKAYGVVPAKNVIAEKNVNIYNIINDKKVYYSTANKAQTLIEAIDSRNANPGKLYLLLGSNGIPGYSNTRQIAQYKELIEMLKAKYPNAMIYVETVTPITATAKGYTDEFKNSKIDDFNEKLEELVKSEGVYFLKVNEILKDSNGYLKSTYNAGDGIHLTKSGHEAMYKYYKTHVVQTDKTVFLAEAAE